MKDIENKVQEKVASSLTANGIELLPFIPYLLQDLWELGSSPEDIMHLIKKHISISNNTKMLDLACGKGAVSVNICKELNIETKG
ncbi:MAG: class I SAM-dependent methyltransferase, partial [Lachnospiraceae bacterium]|nr:class I SAM-dependent methyltransferase [Lachnospiraceae bacterium]